MLSVKGMRGIFIVLVLVMFLTALACPVESQATNTSKVLVTIPVGSGPYRIVYNAYNHNMYVSNFNSNSISVINSSSNKVIATINSSNYIHSPAGLDYNPINHNIYVANYGSNLISEIDSSNNLIKILPAGSNPIDIICNTYNNETYVSNFNSNTVTVINSSTDASIGTIHIPRPHDMTYSPTDGHVYVYSYEPITNGSVYSLNNTNITTVTRVPGNNDQYYPSIAYNSYDHNVYVTTKEPTTVTIINPSTSNTIVAKVPLGGPGGFVTPNNSTMLVLVSIPNLNAISVVNPILFDVIEDIPMVGGSPGAIAFDPFNGNYYVANSQNNTVSVIKP
jgi:YVTN family beta-propeller protein